MTWEGPSLPAKGRLEEKEKGTMTYPLPDDCIIVTQRQAGFLFVVVRSYVGAQVGCEQRDMYGM